MIDRADLPDLAVAGAILAASTLLTAPAQASGAKLLVFLHVAVKQRALQSALQAALAGIEVNAVGRIGDFERSLKEGVDAVVALPPVLSAYKLAPTLRGQRSGSSEERYSLVGVGDAPDPGRVVTVGALDLLGRDGTTNFVKSILGSSPKVERVSKVEDLLPLLQMQRADSVLLPSRLFSEIKSASKLSLSQRELAKAIGLPAAAQTTPAGAQVLASLSKVAVNVSKILGVDSWY